METATDDAAGSGMGMDLAVIAQLWGDKQAGLDIQRDTLKLQQLFRPGRALDPARLRVLAIACASDIGANTPIEFLLEAADIDLAMYYHAVAGAPRPDPDAGSRYRDPDCSDDRRRGDHAACRPPRKKWPVRGHVRS